ncbi:EAL domain-containing protein [Rhodoferax sp.]|uniref:putative bifunctional diguanylate cyclase/phosphodiesterase n=1 Tax=Rhodoferax sp. TaxID=50421 RepID=UPI00260C98FA|nr:EAL domain-containing protein [Rhodoferax sp.]MDD2925172.1 EAL domain-containing protein [Rhodoferax sp.]
MPESARAGGANAIWHSASLQQYLAGELHLLELLATDTPLNTLLETYTRSYEASFPGVLCSVLLLDPDGIHLRHTAAPSLPAAYSQAIDGVAVGPSVGSCGTAAFTRQAVIVSDIATDPLWQGYREPALTHGLRACWSVPILSTKGQVVGTFANYYRQPRSPDQQGMLAIQHSAYLLGLFIEHHRLAQTLATQQEALRESEARYRTLVEWSPKAVAVHRHGVILYVNAATVTMLGARSADELLGRHIADFLHPDDLQIGLERARIATETGVNAPAREEKLLRLDGSTVTVEIQSAAIVYDGAPAVYVVAHDLSQRRADEETIHHLAFYDALTGLPNRRLLLDRLQQALLASGRQNQYGALMLLDLDHFKHINDLVGHDVGDALLKQVAERLQSCVRQSDSVARVGGDEFMVLLETFAVTADEAAQYAKNIASKIASRLSEPYTLFGVTYTSTPSIGIVVFLEGTENRDDMIKKADAAMYQAKAAGRNAVRFFDPTMQAQALARAEFEQDMRHGFEQHEFLLHYQLQVNTQGQPTGAEALVRWASAKHGLVSPARFIPLAEDNGLILPLGQYVLESACAQLVAWAQHPVAGHWTVAVNVSARQFAQEQFVGQVALALQKTGANPTQLKLELTESMLVKNVDAVIAKMNAIKAMGVSFSLDDFGTGYSSLSYLKVLPLAQLKIDQSFVRDLLTDPNDAVIARTIVALGHSLGMKVIAEGVETTEQRDLLINMGCDAFQGYLFGRPTPPEQLPFL